MEALLEQARSLAANPVPHGAALGPFSQPSAPRFSLARWTSTSFQLAQECVGFSEQPIAPSVLAVDWTKYAGLVSVLWAEGCWLPTNVSVLATSSLIGIQVLSPVRHP